MWNGLVFAMLVLGFATFVTTHLVLVIRFTVTRPRWRGPLALLLPPLAPIYAWREQRRWSTGLWIGAVSVYAAGMLAHQLG